jgi:6-phosphogluconolactonase
MRETWRTSSPVAARFPAAANSAMLDAVRTSSGLLGVAISSLLACGTGGGGGGDGSSSDSTAAPTSTAMSTTTSTTATTASDDSSGTTTTPSDTSSESGEPGTSGTTDPTIDAVALYVSSGATLYRFDVGLDAGTLVQQDAIDLGTGLGPLAHDPVGRWLFGGLVDDAAIASWRIADDGSLEEIGRVPVGMSAVYLSITGATPYLLAADFGSAVLASHAIDSDGLVVTPAVGWLDVLATPHAIVPTPDGTLAFAPHLQPNRITAYRIDAGGALSGGLPEIVPPRGAGPRHMIFRPDGAVAWVANELGDSITTWQVAEPRGTLVELQTLSTLASGTPDGGNDVADLHITPDGRFLYVSNRGDDTLAMFAVQPDGTLVAIGHVDTEPHVRDFGLDPTGSFVFAAGRDSGQLASYAIGEDGGLTPVGTVAVPPAPIWVEPVAL